MESNKISSEMWRIISEDAWREAARESTDVSSMKNIEKMGSMIAEKLGSLETKAFAESIGVLVDYAEKDMGEDETALDAESEAIAVAKKTVRPIVEVKLQKRLNDLDRKQSGKMRCVHCGGKRKVGDGARCFSSSTVSFPLSFTVTSIETWGTEGKTGDGARSPSRLVHPLVHRHLNR